MVTKRDIINSLRKKIQEVNADSNYTNKELYKSLMEQSEWIIRREISAGRIHRNTNIFRPLTCQDVIETSITDECCPIKTNCKIYRTKNKTPEIWSDDYGQLVKRISSIDNSTSFIPVSPMDWDNISSDPYQKKQPQKYVFYSAGYWWFPEYNPHKVNILAFFKDDITNKSGCSDNKDCVRFLDTEFPVPGYLHAEILAKTIQIILPSKQMPEDQQIDKNTNRKN